MERDKAEELKEYRRQYYLKNREKRRKKIQCGFCGRRVCAEYIQSHYRRKICLNKTMQNNENA